MPRRTRRNQLLIKEGFYISARYAFHVMGMSLFIVIFSSVLKETPAQFSKGLSFSIPNILLIAALMYIAYIWSKNILNEIQKDILSFSHAYRLTWLKAAIAFLLVLGSAVFLFVVFLRVGF